MQQRAVHFAAAKLIQTQFNIGMIFQPIRFGGIFSEWDKFTVTAKEYIQYKVRVGPSYRIKIAKRVLIDIVLP